MSSKVEFRVALLGDSAVGKTSLITRLTRSRSDSGFGLGPTVGASFFVHSVPFEDDLYELQIWDTAGQEQYHSLASTYYRNAQGILVVFDVSKKWSFFSAQKWIGELLSMNKKYVIILVGNKIDLSTREVFSDAASAYAHRIGVGYSEVSAKTSQNVENTILQLIMAAKEENIFGALRGQSTVKLEDTTEQSKNSNCLCSIL